MKCKFANRINYQQFNIIMLFLVVLTVNFGFSFANNLQDKPVNKKTSSFLSAKDSTENMDALDALSMFADMDNPKEFDELTEGIKGGSADKKDSGNPPSAEKADADVKVFFKAKEPLSKDNSQNSKVNNKLSANTESIKKETKPKEPVHNSGAVKSTSTKNKTSTSSSKYIPNSKKYYMNNSKPNYKKMYSKANLNTKHISTPVVKKTSSAVLVKNNIKENKTAKSFDSNENTNSFGKTNKEIKESNKVKNGSKIENIHPSLLNTASNSENEIDDFDAPIAFTNKIPEQKINKINKNTPQPKEEDKKLFSELDPNFVKNLIKMQNDPNIKKFLTNAGAVNISLANLSKSNDSVVADSPIRKVVKEEVKIPAPNPAPTQTTQNNSNDKDNTPSFDPISFLQKSKEKISKSQVKSFYKPEELDMSKLIYLNDLISKVRIDVQKKTMENDQLVDTNKQLEKNYEQLNSQLMIYQTKMDSILNEIKLLSSMKSSYTGQIDKTKEANNLINDLNDFFKKINIDISSKEDSVQKYEDKVQMDLKSFNDEKVKLDVTSSIKQKQLEEVKKVYAVTEKSKNKLIESIKKNFEDYSREEIKFLKLKNEEGDLELQVKNEENAEKLIALEIEHLKNTNMIEIQKIEELKQEIEKSKNLRDYLKKEIDELEEKLKNTDSENKQNQIEYELKKNELEDKLRGLKDEVKSESNLNLEEKQKYNQIESDIKNKISYISLQNSNILDKRDDYVINHHIPEVKQPEHAKSNNSPVISGSKINNLVDAFYDFKQKEESNNILSQLTKNNQDSAENESKLKKQILKLLKKLNE